MEFHYDGPVVDPLDNSHEILSMYGEIDENCEYIESACILADGGDRYGVAAIAFDPLEELLWMGNQGGHVTSYYSSSLQKYTSFQITTNQQDIRHLQMIDEGILALTASQLRFQMRRGIPIFTHNSSNMVEMQCMLQLSPTRLLMAGHQDKMIDFNLTLAKETDLIQVGESGCALLRLHNRFICAGDPLGTISLHDPNSLNVEHRLETHSGSLSDFDVQGNLLITCGFSNNRSIHNSVSCDRFLMVYDLRMLRLISPIQVVVDPLYLRFFPSISSRLAVVTAMGQIQLVDTVALSEPTLSLYQINHTGAMCMAFDLSSTSQAMALGDSGGSIHLFTSNNGGNGGNNSNGGNSDILFNSYSRQTEHADLVHMQVPSISYDDLHTTPPLSIIPLPILNNGQTTLASDWPSQFTKKVYRRAPGIDPEILRTMKMQGPIGYAPNPKSTRRNQVMYQFENKRNNQSKSFNGSDAVRHHQNKNGIGGSDSDGFIAIPKRYRKFDTKYNTNIIPMNINPKNDIILDISSGDNNFNINVNKSGLPGLESTLPNSYCNSMIQVLYYIEPLRVKLLSHTCTKEFCLSCELGFLFYMMDNTKMIAASNTSSIIPCQPANFLRAFRTVPEASALGLILSDMHPDAKLKIDLVRLIQSWNRFILHQMHYELLETRKRKIEEEQKQAAKEVKPFVYKETDFPSIMGNSGGSVSSSSTSSRKQQSRINNQKHVINDDYDNADTSKETDLSEKRVSEEETEISKIFGTKQIHINRCLKCNHEITKESILLVCNLVYPLETDPQNPPTFIDLLSKSLRPEQTTPAWCDNCSRFTPTNQSRNLQSLPQVLSVNCGLENTNDKQYWQINPKPTNPSGGTSSSTSNIKPCRYGSYCARPGCRFKHLHDEVIETNEKYYSNSWLPHQIELNIDDKLFKYNLSSVVCYVNDDKRNLVSLIKVPKGHLKSNKTSDEWFLFNDVCVVGVPAQEAVWFSLDWKVPCVLYYVADYLDMTRVQNVVNPLTSDVFGQDKCLAKSSTNGSDASTRSITFTPLSAMEMPQPGEMVAMDAEFVTLNQEEAELRSDGKLSTIKPSHMSVARITVIRGQGIMEGTPFIDDYISTQEQVVDYLTKFSGIKPGDLDANFSSKHLTTLKATYQKLRFLQDRGVIFVGHGLQNDFRVINLVVPQKQIIDTVQLFHLPHQRMISLRFLAWHFLGTKIQSITHDSAEDARTALHLYQKYLELQSENKVQEALQHLYDVGKSLQWRVPED